MGDFRKKITSLAHRYYSWLTLLSMENTDLEQEDEYDEYATNPDKVSSIFKNVRQKLSLSAEEFLISHFEIIFQMTRTERAAYEDLLVYWEYEDCYYQMEELEKYAVMPIPKKMADIPDVPPDVIRRRTIKR